MDMRVAEVPTLPWLDFCFSPRPKAFMGLVRKGEPMTTGYLHFLGLNCEHTQFSL